MQHKYWWYVELSWVAQSLFGLSMWSLLRVWGCSLVQECCWDICEKYVMGFVLLSVCQSLLNLMFWDFKLVVFLSVIWVGKGTPKSLSYTGASLEAEMDMLAGFSQGASRDVGRIPSLLYPPRGGERWRSTVGERLCVECVFTVLHWAHMPGTPLYRSVCLVRCNSDWWAGICSALHFLLNIMSQ